MSDTWEMTDPQWAGQLHAEVEAEMMRLMDSVDAEDPVEADVETPSGDPFCGCETCWLREVLTLAVTRTLAAVDAGLFRKVE